jgi:hypothetical protein
MTALSTFLSMADYPAAILSGKHGPLNDKQKEFLEVILENSRATVRLVVYLFDPGKLPRIPMDALTHSLNNLLTPIMGYTALLYSGAAGPLTPEQRQALRQLSDLGSELHDLVTVVFETQSAPLSKSERQHLL